MDNVVLCKYCGKQLSYDQEFISRSLYWNLYNNILKLMQESLDDFKECDDKNSVMSGAYGGRFEAYQAVIHILDKYKP
jgi:hypothetical protein